MKNETRERILKILIETKNAQEELWQINKHIEKIPQIQDFSIASHNLACILDNILATKNNES